MTDVAAIQGAAASMAARLVDQLIPLIPDAAPRIARFIDAATTLGPMDHYKIYPAPARAIADEVAAQHGVETLRRFLRAAIASAIVATMAGARFQNLPPRVAVQQRRHFLRMAGDDSLAEWLSLDQDLFHKEFGLATLRLYGAGSRLVDFRCGVPRSVMLKQGWKRTLPALWYMARCGGFRPFFQVHTHTFNLDQFNEAGSEELYLCCAELYALHPQVLGMYGSSWFYDPAMARVSPRLCYMIDTPLAGGGTVLFVQHGGEALSNALSKSETRRRMYAESSYMPSIYIVLWEKQAQMAWARQRLARGSLPGQAPDQR